ncbi:MAG: hypothetical protein JOZ13_05210 [Alphaproteobacteria bacterium]|nr:hypothetical protein [Alphaproteobacteria bacterium]
MATARKKAIEEKRKRGIRPRCHKVTLTPPRSASPARKQVRSSKANVQADQAFGDTPRELNPVFGDPGVAPPMQHKRKRGAPLGNRNRLVHGDYGRERKKFYADVRAHIRDGKALVALVEELAERIPWDTP